MRTAHRSRKRPLRIVIVGMVSLGVLYVSSGGFFTGSPVNCWHEDVDINSGRIRYTRYLLYCRVTERIEDSILTNYLPSNTLDVGQPDWRRVNTFSPGVRHSPHYSYHDALNDVRRLEEAWQLVPFSNKAKRQVVQNVLQLWQSTGDGYEAGEYISQIWNLASFASQDSLPMITEADLPDVPSP